MDLQVKKPTSIFTILITIVIVVISLVILYFVYVFLYSSTNTSPTKIIVKQTVGNVAQTSLPAVTGLYEGGDYAVSLWIYVNSYNINRNARKHILEIGGTNFSTLLIALGAFKNTLMVRTHSRDSDTVVVGSTTAATNSAGTTTSTTTNIPPPTTTTTTSSSDDPDITNAPLAAEYRFYDSSGNVHYYDVFRNEIDKDGKIIIKDASTKINMPPLAKYSFYDSSGNIHFFDERANEIDKDGKIIKTTNLNPYNSQVYNSPAIYDQLSAGRYASATNTQIYESFQNATPGSNAASIQDGSLTAASLNTLFTPLAMDDSLLNPTQICDIVTIDMQRWVNITVVLSGNMIDVYMDGKLARSCVTPSYYNVDPTGLKMKITERGGFDGYLNNVSTFNSPLSPSDIYRIYQAGPTGTSAGVGSMVSSLFTGEK